MGEVVAPGEVAHERCDRVDHRRVVAAGDGEEGVDRGVVVARVTPVAARAAGQVEAVLEVVVGGGEVVREGDHGDHLLRGAVSLQSRSPGTDHKVEGRPARAIGTCITPSSSNSGPVTTKPWPS